MRLPRLNAIIDVQTARQSGWAPRALARAYLEGGATFLQIRAKTLESGPFLTLVDEVIEDARGYDAMVIVNDRADVARMARAHGVHLGQEDLPATAARDLLGPGALVGLSTHTRAQIAAAAREPITYLAVGPLFGSRTKETGYEAVGLDLVRVAATAGVPVVAIGGITLETARAVIDAGASAVAVIGDLLTGGDPTARVRAYLEALRV